MKFISIKYFVQWLFCWALLLITVQSNAQKQYAIVSSTFLYEQPDVKSKSIGVFARGGTVFFQADAGNGWWKVVADNDMPGYIQQRYTKANLNSSDVYSKDPEIFIQDDHYMGCPHLFVNVASLKGRREPQLNGKIVEVFYINTGLCVDFLPYNPDAWVNVGGYFKEDMIFVQRKYLGKRQDIDSLFNLYAALPDTVLSERKRWIERIVEMGWGESLEKNIKAQELFLGYAKKNGNSQAITNTTFELFLLKAMQNPVSEEEKEKQENPTNTYIRLNGIKLNFDISFKEITSLNLPYKKVKARDMAECGYETDCEYVFPHFTLGIDLKNKKGYVFKANLTIKGNALVQNGVTIDMDMKEGEFITKLGRYFKIDWQRNPHVYRFTQGDAGWIEIKFENGKPLYLQQFFYC